jgi:hypothetical protein
MSMDADRGNKSLVRRCGRWFLLVAISCLLATHAGWAGCHDCLLASSFTKEEIVGWDLSPTGLLTIYYGKTGLKADRLSLHRIVEQGYEPWPDDVVRRSFGNQVSILHSGEPDAALPYSYIYLTNPLYYGNDLDRFGQARRVWEDIAEDGLNGNEVRVSLPSGW